MENVLGLANGLPVERGAKLKERVVAYAKAAAKYEWPAMAHRADMDDPVFKALDAVLAGLTIELSSEIAQGMPHRSHQCSCRRFSRRAARACRG